jgi:prevent-host-death family protein
MSVSILTTTEARKNLLEMVDKAGRAYKRYLLTKKGKPVAVLMSAEEYEGWVETLELASDPEFIKALKEAQSDVRAGRVFPYEKVTGKKQKKQA